MNCPLKSREIKKLSTFSFVKKGKENIKEISLKKLVMTPIKYTKEQIAELKGNTYVRNCTEKHIVFHTAFKILAVQEGENFLTPKEIFRKHGFPEYVVQTDTPKNALARWKRNKTQKGKVEEQKGRPKEIDFSNMTLEQEHGYLKAKLAIFEELNNLDLGNFP